jgi:putative transposase
VREAIHRWVRPPWVISDRDPVFTSRRFTRLLRRHAVRRRFGAIGSKATLARIERFWRTLKDGYVGGLFLYRPLRTIDRDLDRYATWFNRERPHEGLRGRTPDGVHYSRKQEQPRLIHRARLDVRFLRGDRNLPMVRLRRAA